MSKKRKSWKNRKHHWIRFGKFSIYEGTHAIAVGNTKTGYLVFASKNAVEIEREGKLRYKNESGLMGTYDTRKQAGGLVRETDKTLTTKGEVESIVVSGPDEEGMEAFSQSDPKTGGTILFYKEGDEVGKVHEGAHYLLGHHRKGKKGRESGLGTLRTEKDTVETAIRWHKLREEYTPKIRNEIAKRLATYYKSGSKKDKEKRARRFVKKVEK